MTDLFNEHARPVDYFGDFYAVDVVWQRYMSFPPFQFSEPLAQMQRIVQQNHERAPDRELTTRTLVADGDVVVKESQLNSADRDVRAIAVTRWHDGKIVEMREYSVVLPREGEPLHRTPHERANEAAARRWVELFNAGTQDWWDDVYAPDVTWEAYSPDYHSSSGDALKALTTQALEVFPDRAFEVLSVNVDGERVIIEAIWTGTAAKPGLRFNPGDRRIARYVIFQTYRDGKIVAIRNCVLETIEEEPG